MSSYIRDESSLPDDRREIVPQDKLDALSGDGWMRHSQLAKKLRWFGPGDSPGITASPQLNSAASPNILVQRKCSMSL
jgi:hypothetical protein